jgi:GTP-binding protein EngB required for normal cell division
MEALCLGFMVVVVLVVSADSVDSGTRASDSVVLLLRIIPSCIRRDSVEGVVVGRSSVGRSSAPTVVVFPFRTSDPAREL